METFVPAAIFIYMHLHVCKQIIGNKGFFKNTFLKLISLTDIVDQKLTIPLPLPPHVILFCLNLSGQCNVNFNPQNTAIRHIRVEN